MRYVILMILLTIGVSLTAQTVTGDVIKAKDRVEFRGYKIEQIQNDTALPTNSIMKLPTEYAVKQYVLNHLGGGSGGGDGKVYFITAVADTNTILDPKSGDVAVVTAASKLYQYSTSWIYKSDIDLSNTNEIQTISLTGDVTGSGTGSFAATIANDAVTNAKMANMATNRLKGRSTAGTGDPEDIVVGAGLSLSAGTLSATGGGQATAGGNPTDIQVNVGGVLGSADSIVITQSPGDRLGIGKRTGLGARLHIQSQASDESPAILIDNSAGKRVANLNSYGVMVLGGVVSNGATGRIELNRYSDGMTYGTIWSDEIDSILTIHANKNGMKFLAKATPTAYMTDQGWKFGIGAYNPPNSSAIVEMDGIGDKIKGLLLPRGNTTQRNAITSPANLLLFGNTSTGKIQYYNSGGWKALMDSASVAGVYLPLAGGTLTGNLLFNPDNTYDIGTNSTSRPRSIYTSTGFETAGTGKYTFNNRGGITASSDGVFRVADNAGTSFGRLQFGGTTNAYPAIKRSTTQLQFRLADDTGNAEITAGSLVLGGTSMSSSLIADLQSTTKAFRPPVMTQTQRDAIVSPPGGSVVYNSTSQKINYNTGGSWVELGTGGGTVTSIVAGSSNTTKGLSAVESPAGTYTIGLNLGSLGIISPLTASDTSTYIVTQKAIGFENSKVQIRDLVYDAYGESYQNTETNLGVLTSNVEYDLKLANAGLNKLFDYNSTTGILKYNGTISKNFIAQFNGVFHSSVVGEITVKIYTAPATGTTWTLLTQCKVYLPTIGNTQNYSCRRRVTLSQGMRVKAVVVQQPSGTAFCDMGTLSVDAVTTN